MKKLVVAALAILSVFGLLTAQEIRFSDAWNDQGFTLASQSAAGVEIDYSIEAMKLSDIDINGRTMTELSIPGVILPNDEGAPNLPGDSRWIALPEGAKATVTVTASRVETYYDIEMSPAPRIPLETEDGPLEYRLDPAIYDVDAFYPAQPVKLSEQTELRGVDAVILGVTPFQYNPVTRELRVYRDLQIRVDFTGGIGKFGEDRLRSPWWDPILKAAFINAASLPEVTREHSQHRTPDYDYIILTADNPQYIAWAESLAAVRNKQGIYTAVVTTTDIGGGTAANIEAYIDDAYYNWDYAPSAVLILGDYGTTDYTVTSPVWSSYCISDNFYADVTGDDLPDVALARMTANNEAELAIMMNKAINYEYSPPTDPDFYNKPVIAGGWQTERWFILCTEVVHGFMVNELGKTPVREYAIYDGSPGSTWSTATNTSTVTSYFGPSGLGYIPSTPGGLNDWGGNATRINADINAGSFMMLHRDHGSEYGWGEPDYDKYDLAGLVDNEPVYVFSVNCLTGKFNYSNETFAEAFHRHEDRALGIIAATEVSYSFVNDAYVWGMMDLMWPEFMPANGSPGPHNLLPAFANAYGKIFLAGSSWPYNSGDKEVTYYLFHAHGDAFTRLNEEAPQSLTVNHATAVETNANSFVVSANAGAYVCLSVNGDIIGGAYATGSPTPIAITPQFPPATVDVTVTMQNYDRYEVNIPVAASGPPQPNIIVDPSALLYGSVAVGMSSSQPFTITNVGNQTLTGAITAPEGYTVVQNRVVSRNTLNFSIPEYTSASYNLVFAPMTTGSYNGDLVITSNDPDEPTSTIALTGAGYEPCDIDVTPSTLTTNVQQNQTDTQTLYVSNTGVATLYYQADIDFNPSSRDVLVSADFEDGVMPPAGWTTEILNGSVDWEISNETSYSGSYSALASWEDCYDARLISPAFQVSEDCQLSFWIRTQDTPEYGGDFDVEISTDGSNWTSLASWDQDTWTQTWSQEILDASLQAYEGQTVQLAFRAWNNYWADGVCIDDITVTGTPYPTGWLEINGGVTLMGDVFPGATDAITVDFNSTDLPLGVYQASIVIQSDDPDESLVSVPVTMSVTEGTPAINVSSTALDFGQVLLGETSTLQLSISNPGTGTLYGIFQTPDNFEIELQVPPPALSQFGESQKQDTEAQQRFDQENFIIAPGGTETYDIVFTPAGMTVYSEIIIIEHTAGPNMYVDLLGEGVAPQISVAPDSIYALQQTNEITSHAITVANTGTSDLTWSAQNQPVRANGRDLFGYSWLSSVDPGGPAYNWVDIVATGTPITLGDDDSLDVALPFTFPFYGEDHNEVCISSNGFLTFGEDGTSWTNYPIPTADQPNNIICPFWDDLKPIGASGSYDWGTVYYQIDAANERLIVQYENVAHYNSTTPSYWETFEVIISSNGSMLFQYESLDLTTSCTVGIENFDASDGEQIVYDTAYLQEGMAILVSPPTPEIPWLSFMPENGVLAPGMSQDITLTINSADMPVNGDYITYLLVNSDDLDTPNTLVPVRMDVQFLPDPPANVEIQIVGDVAILTWDAVPGATLYTLYYSENGVTFHYLLDTTETTFTIPGIEFTNKLYIYVTAQ